MWLGVNSVFNSQDSYMSFCQCHLQAYSIGKLAQVEGTGLLFHQQILKSKEGRLARQCPVGTQGQMEETGQGDLSLDSCLACCLCCGDHRTG